MMEMEMEMEMEIEMEVGGCDLWRWAMAGECRDTRNADIEFAANMVTWINSPSIIIDPSPSPSPILHLCFVFCGQLRAISMQLCIVVLPLIHSLMLGLVVIT